ncbi:TPA: fimbrial biogenesis usher protein [Providencia rettgeri]|uniref:fimbrial biogenesis usher protein n=1 Tax=Providencia rettgeri TaxID=587 RepID=UPI000A658435|nr:fimbrial biogenesis usher protein [Providencia rettgeri]EJD6672740.1 fimbrial biogenesis usher protein [Providencia rettgeri]HEM7509593.1 fimbrial biogenesis usher protein [Providencia rettgeri]HEM8269623.1 fimbrial biogenesis usher protein [Providencia rettgeri]
MSSMVIYHVIKKRTLYTFNISLPCLLALMVSLNVNPIYAEEIFNPAFLSSDVGDVADLSRYEKGEGQPPGVYQVDLYLNDTFLGAQHISFSTIEKTSSVDQVDDTGLTPCLAKGWLIKQGVNIMSIPELAGLDDADCVDLPNAIDKASTNFEFDKQQLHISVPQAMLMYDIRGYVSPEYWNNGVPALFTNYNFSARNNKNTDKGGDTNSNYFLSLNSGINLGPWRIRNESTWNTTGTGGRHKTRWNNVASYIQRAITPLRATLTVGDSVTDSDIFDSLSFRGVQLASDENMLPESQRGFAPVVRGIANTNAQVTIEQNGYIIYQTHVPPGAFEIKDLYSTASSGDLTVIVKENNGTVNRFTVPYSAVPILQREGHFKYALTAGRYRSGYSGQGTPDFIQGTLVTGLQRGLTFYQGFLTGRNYNAIAAGLGKNLGQFGAISLDVTHANSRLPDGSNKSGQSLRFLYAKSLNQLGTNFQLLGYRYSTKGFYTFSETTYNQMKGYQTLSQDGVIDVEPTLYDYHNLYYTKKGKIQANVSQNLGKYGSVYFSASYQDYWHTNETDQLIQLGYNSSWEDLTYNLNMSWNKVKDMGGRDKRLAFNVSIPFDSKLFNGRKMDDIAFNRNSAFANYSATYEQDSQVTQTAGVSGTLLEGRNLNYSVQQGYGNKGMDASGNASLDYRGGYGNVNVGYAYGKHWQQVNYGVSGGLLLHEDGLTLSQPLGDTSVLVKVPDVSGIEVLNSVGVKTDWRGYAVVPNATAYRNNRIALNVNSFSDNVEVDDNITNVVPTKGAIVMADFKASIGYRALITITQRNGNKVPFGAMVTDQRQKGNGIVGEDGEVFMSGLADSGILTVSWGKREDQQCTVDYQLPVGYETNKMNYATAQCK